jgi:hypothetical protein
MQSLYIYFVFKFWEIWHQVKSEINQHPSYKKGFHKRWGKGFFWGPFSFKLINQKNYMATSNKEPTTQKDPISMRRDGTQEMNVSMGRFILISRSCKVNIIFLNNNMYGLQKNPKWVKGLGFIGFAKSSI